MSSCCATQSPANSLNIKMLTNQLIKVLSKYLQVEYVFSFEGMDVKLNKDNKLNVFSLSSTTFL